MDAVPGLPFASGHPNGRSRSGASPKAYVRHLSLAEVGCRRQDDAYHPCPFEMFVRAGLPLAECVMLGEEAHREFMDRSGLLVDLLAPAYLGGGTGEGAGSRTLRIRLSHLSSPIEGELNRQICAALIRLHTPSVAVVSEWLVERHLKSIPEVKDAIREAWLYPEGLARQVEAASRGEEVLTWPVSILVEDRAK
jgi:hypothetical protein